MVWWEAVLSPALQVLFDKLADGDIMQFLHSWNINDSLLEKLKISFYTNTAVLGDAEEKQYDNPAVETWLDMLKDAVHEAEDILDQLATEALRCKLEATEHAIAKPVRNWSLISTPLNSFPERIGSKIEKIIDRLEYIASQKDVLGLKGRTGSKHRVLRRTPTTPLLVESSVYGREIEKEDIIKLLIVDDENRRNQLLIIPILGMGGLGKTTLSQIVYNDNRIDEYFDVKAWACVSDEFDVVNITKAVLESSTGKSWDTMNLELLQSNLKIRLSKKRFFVVLDDVWNENYNCWNELMVPFMHGAHGSKIIVTTRNEEVLSVMNALPPYRLKEMSSEVCWSLFEHHAFQNKGSNSYPELENIGREIAKKCKGLPLAAKTLAVLLACKLDTGYWNDILNSKFWVLPPVRSNILPVLMLSYYHLPANLKRCFAYCSIFPKDYEFDREKLVALWMAEGFVQQVEEGKRMEEVGDTCFSDLLSRSFFQESPHHKSRYIMHDLINDLALFVSRKRCSRLEEKSNLNQQIGVFEKTLHMSFARGKYDVFKKFQPLHEAKSLRTFLPLESPYGAGFSYLSNKVLHDLLPKLRCLRTLSLSGYCITEIADSIGNMKLLRYFDLSHTAIKALPESVSTLYNLQALLLNDCDSLTKLTIELGNLVNLRHFDISRSGLEELPIRVGNLRSLQTLPEFIVSSGSGSGIGELRYLAHIRGRLSISKLENVVDAWEGRRARLTDKQNLDELLLGWSRDIDALRDERVETDVLDFLQPHQNLQNISIEGYGGTRFPTWLGDPTYSCLIFVTLTDCEKCISLPPLGQLPSLKKLYICRMTGVKRLGAEFYGVRFSAAKAFPQLEVLSFKEMVEWEYWVFPPQGEETTEAFCSLRELYLENCHKLRMSLPAYLPSLTKLVIHECQQMVSLLPRASSLRELDLKGCDNLLLRSAEELNLLLALRIAGVPKLKHLPERLIQCLKALEVLEIFDCFDLRSLWQHDGPLHFPSLRHLIIRNCPSLTSLFYEDQEVSNKLEYLELDYCQGLEKLPHWLCSLTSLSEFIVKECPKLKSFEELVLPSKLKGFAIRGCGMEFFPEAMFQDSNMPLEYLYLSGCYDFTSFTRAMQSLPTTFKQLTIDFCPNLQTLPKGMMHHGNTFLKDLEIFNCSALTSFPAGHLPSTLKTLTICKCFNLEALPEFFMQDNDDVSLESFRLGDCTSLRTLPNCLHQLKYLDYLEIDCCPSLVSFPEGGLPVTSLKKVNITNCENLKSLPNQMQNLTSLQELLISGCPSITSFPESDLPVNLISLEVKGCQKVKPLQEWGLHRLNSLRKFSIDGGYPDMVSFPEWLLPCTLTTLHIGRLPNLQSLSIWMRHLTALEELKIQDCHKLQTLPEEDLPATLSRLEVIDCPLLERWCEDDWTKVDHIPCILM